MGQLKVFLGMAAGVGKTYSMLERAQKDMKLGIDLIVGVVNTHGRVDTAKLLEGLPLLPEKIISYKGHSFKELDLESIIKRKPQLVLVDELAHSNIPGSKNEKRWQDVLEILEAGINVYTTLNIQHIESYKEIIESITGIKISETVPDLIIERATNIELIDITPQELIQRLKEGKVYTGELSEIAIQNFFQENRLTALREIALRFTAEIVDKELQEIFLALQQGKEWKPKEYFLVAIDYKSTSSQLIRTTRRRAFTRHAQWIALYVDNGKKLDEEEERMLAKNFSLARELGAEVITVKDRNIVDGILKCASQKNITQIIIGRSEKKWINPFKRSLINQLLQKNQTIDVQVVQLPFPLHKKKKSSCIKRKQELLKKREEFSQALDEIVRAMGVISNSQLFKLVKEKVGKILQGRVEVVLNKKNMIFEEDSSLVHDDKESGVIKWVIDHGEEAGWSTSTLSFSKNIYIPLKGKSMVVGVLAFFSYVKGVLSLEERTFLYTIAEKLAHYLEHSFLEERRQEKNYFQKVERVYERVLRTIAYELFQPLDLIKRTVLRLKQENIAPKSINQIEKATDTLMHLTESASEMARLSEGLMHFQKKEQDLRPLFVLCTKKFASALEEYHLIVKIPDNLPLLPFDFALMEILLTNLLMNAIQYSPPKTTIELEAEIVNGSFVVSVSDQGPGIPEEMTDLIFEKFYRVPGSKSVGLGLGLAIASSITAIHQGELKVHNRPHGGSKFYLILPR